MPIMNGMEFLEELRKNKNYTPFIILTAHGDLPMTVVALRQGALDFIHKPFDIQRVFSSIRQALEYDPSRTQINPAIEELKKKNALNPEQIEKLEKLNQYISNLKKRA